MRRLPLSMKLVIAALPVVLALAGLSALTVRDGLTDVRRAGAAADLSATWEPLVAAVGAVDAEREATAGRAVEVRRTTNRAMVETEQALLLVGDDLPALEPHARALIAIGAARASADDGLLDEAAASYELARSELVAVGRLLPVEAGSAEQGRALGVVAGLVEVEQTALVVLGAVDTLTSGYVDLAGTSRLMTEIDRSSATLSLLRSTADDELRAEVRATGLSSALEGVRQATLDLDERLGAGETTATFDRDAAETLASAVTRVGTLRDELVSEVVTSSRDEARTVVLRTWARVGATVLAIGAAVALAVLVSRSITRRVREISDAAQEVTDDRLPVLVEALRDQRGRTALPAVEPIDDHGTDELSELARSFNRMQTTLGEVAREQLEVLERGVSDIFVTMARRNRSLIDRQLSLLDELEAKEEDPATLAHFYRLDHLATRMRRNSESLLVLADSDGRTRLKGSASVDDIVRAAISEVEDYQRIEILSLEHLKIRGAAVADLTHLLAELLENATAFSPPTSRVRVTGDLIDGRYRILVMDEGMGIPEVRLTELNDLLAHPPVLGLSVEPTLGMSVVSLLAGAHGVAVELLAGSPGTIARVVLPASVFERRLTDRPEADVRPVPVRPPLEDRLQPPAIESIREAPSEETPEEIADARPDRTTKAATRQARRTRRRSKDATATGTSGRGTKVDKGDRRARRRRGAEHVGEEAPETNPIDPPDEAAAAPLTLRLSDLVNPPSPTDGPAVDDSPSAELAALARGREEGDRRDGPPHSAEDADAHEVPGSAVDDLGFNFGFDRHQPSPGHSDPFLDDHRVIDPGVGSGPDPLPRRERRSALDDHLDSVARTSEEFGELGDLDITPSWARRDAAARPSADPFTADPATARPSADPFGTNPPIRPPADPLADRSPAAPPDDPFTAAPPTTRPPATPFTALPPAIPSTPSSGPVPPPPNGPAVPPPSTAAMGPMPPPGATPSPAFGPPGSEPRSASPPPPPPPPPVIGELPTRRTGAVPITTGDERSVTGVGAPSDLKAALVAFELGRRSAVRPDEDHDLGGRP